MPTNETSGYPPELSLIFVNYRSVGTLAASLASLAEEIGTGPIEIIIVNNDPSEQDPIDRLAGRFPVRIVDSGKNIGFGAASNLGAQEAGANILGFLNPDTRLAEGSLREIVRHFETHPETGIAGASLVGPDGKPETWSSGPSATLGRILGNNLGFLHESPKRNDAPITIDFVSGAALFIRRSLFRRLGGFDERFFLYFEDMDLCLRARTQGSTVIRMPKPIFTHRGGASQRSVTEQKHHYCAG